MGSTNFHVEELTLVNGQLGALLVTPWPSEIAISHRRVLVEAEIQVEDALRARLVDQVDAEAKKYSKIVLSSTPSGVWNVKLVSETDAYFWNLQLKMKFFWNFFSIGNYRLQWPKGSPWMMILSPGRKCPPGMGATSGIALKKIKMKQLVEIKNSQTCELTGLYSAFILEAC